MRPFLLYLRWIERQGGGIRITVGMESRGLPRRNGVRQRIYSPEFEGQRDAFPAHLQGADIVSAPIIRSMLVSIAAIACGTGAALADQSIYSCTNPDGTIELTGQPTSDQCEQLVAASEPVAATLQRADIAPGAGTVPGASASAPRPVEHVTALAATAMSDGSADADSRAQYHDLMIQGAQGAEGAPAAATNPSVSRRYLMMNRSTYQQALANGK